MLAPVDHIDQRLQNRARLLDMLVSGEWRVPQGELLSELTDLAEGLRRDAEIAKTMRIRLEGCR